MVPATSNDNIESGVFNVKELKTINNSCDKESFVNINTATNRINNFQGKDLLKINVGRKNID